MRRHYKELLSEVLKNGIFFVLSKGVAFCAPILFIRFVSLTEYGVVEYSYSTGSLLAMCTLLGLNGAYPYFILKKGETEKEEAFLFYGIPVAFISGLFYLGRYLGVVSQALSFIILFTLIFSLQRLYSTILKSGGKGYLGVLLDGGYYFVLALALVLFKVGGVGDAIDTLEKLMALYLGVLSLFYIWRYFVNKTKPFKHTLFKFYPEILGYSVKMIVSGLIIFFLVSSNRIYLKFLLGYEEVGIYSFYFRLVGIAVVIHQFLYIAFFKKIYLADSKKVDYYYLFMMIMVLSGCLLILFVFPFIKDIIGIQYEFNDVKLYLLLTVQMVLWVGISLCETIIGRENLIVRQNCYIGGCVAVFPIILWIISPYINLMNFTLANIVLLYVAMALQIKISNGINIKLNRCLCFNSVLLLSALIIYLI